MREVRRGGKFRIVVLSGVTHEHMSGVRVKKQYSVTPVFGLGTYRLTPLQQLAFAHHCVLSDGEYMITHHSSSLTDGSPNSGPTGTQQGKEGTSNDTTQQQADDVATTIQPQYSQ